MVHIAKHLNFRLVAELMTLRLVPDTVEYSVLDSRDAVGVGSCDRAQIQSIFMAQTQ